MSLIFPPVAVQSDFSPFLDVLTDELDQLYWEGLEVKVPSGTSFICHAMLLSIVTDYRGMPEMFRLAQSPTFVGACYKCEQVGRRMAEGSAKTIYQVSTVLKLWHNHITPSCCLDCNGCNINSPLG